MALQTSGAISLNDIHIEAGGTTATSATINDTDIRDLIGKTSATTMAFDEWYGAFTGPTVENVGTITAVNNNTLYNIATSFPAIATDEYLIGILFAKSNSSSIPTINDFWYGQNSIYSGTQLANIGFVSSSRGYRLHVKRWSSGLANPTIRVGTNVSLTDLRAQVIRVKSSDGTRPTYRGRSDETSTTTSTTTSGTAGTNSTDSAFVTASLAQANVSVTPSGPADITEVIDVVRDSSSYNCAVSMGRDGAGSYTVTHTYSATCPNISTTMWFQD